MLIVVAVNFSMALEANRNRVVNVIDASFPRRDDVIGLDLDTTKAMADAAPPMDCHEQFGNIIALESQSSSPRLYLQVFRTRMDCRRW